MSLTLNDLKVTCPRCGGTGAIESSQSEDGRFSYQDQCPDCSSYGVVPLTVEVAESLGGEVLESGYTVEDARVLWVERSGRYLVIPIPEKEEEDG